MKLNSFKGWRGLSGRKRRAGIYFILPTFLYFLFVYYYPLIQSFLISFHEVSPQGSLKYAGLALYRGVWRDPVFWLSVKNTFYFVISSVVFTVVLALIVALLLDSLRSRILRSTFSTMYFLPQAVSLVAAALIWSWIYHPIHGLLNYLLSRLGFPPQQWLSSTSQVIPSLAIINIWLRLGFDVIIFLAALQAMPTEYYEAAYIDGANRFDCIRHIALPLLNPHIVFVSIVELLFAFKIFDQVYVTTRGGPANSSLMIMIHLYDTAFKFNKFGEASVMAVFLFIFLMIISILQWRFFRRAVRY